MDDASENDPAAWDLVYSEALRANREQQQALDSLRGRAPLLVAGAGAASAVVARSALPDGCRAVVWWFLVGLAILAALIGLILTLIILWPRNWEFRQKVEHLVGKARSGATAMEMQQGMILVFEQSWEANQAKLKLLQALFIWALVAVVLEYVFLVIAEGVVS